MVSIGYPYLENVRMKFAVSRTSDRVYLSIRAGLRNFRPAMPAFNVRHPSALFAYLAK